MTFSLRQLNFGKLGISICLFLFFVAMIVQNCKKIAAVNQRSLSTYFVLDRGKVGAKAKIMTLNRLLPRSFDYLLAFTQKKENFDQQKFQEYADYYQKIVEYMPQRADAHAMLGFCYYYLNKPRQAIAAFKKAIVLNPQFSGYYYNLGVIYFKSGNYPAAVEASEKALVTKPQLSMGYILSSREIYWPLLTNQANPKEFIEQQLQISYRYNRILLTQSYLRLKGSPEASLEADKLDLRIF